MTTINVAVLRDRIVMATDGLATGKRPQLMPKVIAIPHLPAALAVRGPSEIASQIPRLVCEFEGIPAMRDGLPVLLKRKYGMGARFFPGFFNFEVVVVGYHAGQALAFSFSSRTWATEPIEDGYISPAVDTAGIPPITATDPRQIDLQAARSMGAVMQRQRAEYGDVGCGGFGQLTSVFSSGQILTRLFAKY